MADTEPHKTRRITVLPMGASVTVPIIGQAERPPISHHRSVYRAEAADHRVTNGSIGGGAHVRAANRESRSAPYAML